MIPRRVAGQGRPITFRNYGGSEVSDDIRARRQAMSLDPDTGYPPGWTEASYDEDPDYWLGEKAKPAPVYDYLDLARQTWHKGGQDTDLEVIALCLLDIAGSLRTIAKQ